MANKKLTEKDFIKLGKSIKKIGKLAIKCNNIEFMKKVSKSFDKMNKILDKGLKKKRSKNGK
jgi:hypothetical protein